MKFELCGLPVDQIDTDGTVARILARCGEAGGAPLVVSSCNVDMVVKASRDPSFAEALASADILTADGMPVVWLGRARGGRFPERVAGSELVPRVSKACARHGYSVFFFGGRPGIPEAAAARLLAEAPELRIAGTLSPPMGFDSDPGLLEQTVAEVRRAAPDVLFVAMGAPRQERFIAAHAAALGAKAILGIGGSLDMLAGRVRRAPGWVQRSGLEWLWRLVQEPRRLFRRYLVDDVAFLPIAWRELRAPRK